jgi:catechol 2,3-dioxygenase-like lactoylglutathione lyase family enzyme
MTEITDTLAPYFFHLAYIVPDLNVAENFFSKTLGVPRFFRTENFVHSAPGCSFRGKPANSSMDFALGWSKDIMIELIRPRSGKSIYSEFVEQKGYGMHHIAFMVPDFAAMKKKMSEAGLEIIAEGNVTNGSVMEYAYFDCNFAGASVIELCGMDDAARAWVASTRT